MDAGVNILCYKSKTLANGAHPLMIRVCKDGKKKYQSLGISVNPKFWDFQKNKPKPKCPNLEYLQKIILDKKLELQKKKLEIKSDQKEYSAATLLEANANLLVAKTVDCFYKEIIAQCEINNKCGNRLVYLNSYNSLKRFTNGKLEIPFNSINVAWLEKYEKYPSVLVYWKMFGTSGRIEHDPEQLTIEQYTVCWDKMYNEGKVIINTGWEFTRMYMHWIAAKGKVCGRTGYLPSMSSANSFAGRTSTGPDAT